MRVIWETCWQCHLEKIEHQERVQVPQILNPNEPFHFSAYTLGLFFGCECLCYLL